MNIYIFGNGNISFEGFLKFYIQPIEPYLDNKQIAVPKADMTKAMVTGEPCTALCGKKWVPSRAPEKYPVCPDCKKIYDARAEMGF